MEKNSNGYFMDKNSKAISVGYKRNKTLKTEKRITKKSLIFYFSDKAQKYHIQEFDNMLFTIALAWL